MDDMLAMGKQILTMQPFSVLLGAELTDFSESTAELRVPIRKDLMQQHGFLHGGVVSYAADNALTYAGGGALKSAVLTSEFKINYVRPALGEYIVARAKVVYAGKTQAVCRCDVFAIKDARERLCATAQGTITKIGKSGISGGGN